MKSVSKRLAKPERLENESAVMRWLSHPNIIKLQATFEDEQCAGARRKVATAEQGASRGSGIVRCSAVFTVLVPSCPVLCAR